MQWMPDPWGTTPTTPSRWQQEREQSQVPQQPEQWPPPYRPPMVGWSSYASPATSRRRDGVVAERRDDLRRMLARSEVRVGTLEAEVQRLERALRAAERRLERWRLSMRNGIITILCLFILAWTAASLVARTPVLPWEMPQVLFQLIR
jgi:hypothetical protein